MAKWCNAKIKYGEYEFELTIKKNMEQSGNQSKQLFSINLIA